MKRLEKSNSAYEVLISELDDPELRLIFELRYFRGMRWREVAAHLPTDLSADAARMKHDRFMKARR